MSYLSVNALRVQLNHNPRDQQLFTTFVIRRTKRLMYPDGLVKLINNLVPIDFRTSIRGPLRRFYLCTFLFSIGSGLTLSLFVIYLHNVRGFSTSFATLLLALSAVVALASAPLWGTMTDRLGPIRVIVFTCTCDTGALIFWALVHTRGQALIAALFIAVFGGGAWGPGSTMLSRLVTPEHRQRAFGFNFMLVNLGLGFGGLISASVVNLGHPGTFVALYFFNAFVALLAAIFYFTLHKHGGPLKVVHDDPAKHDEGWGIVLRDTRLLRYIVASVFLMIGGYGSLDSGLSLFVVNNLKLSVHTIGVLFFFNTTTIVLAQLWVLNKIEHRSRTRVMGVVAIFWFSFWLILETTLALPAFASITVLCLAMAVFAIGETMLQPVGSAIVNEIAPEHLRGRYNAAAGISWSFSSTVAPAITALYFSIHIGNWWPIGTGLTALVGGALMINLRRHISASADGRTALSH
jgi:MFS family permease